MSPKKVAHSCDCRSNIIDKRHVRNCGSHVLASCQNCLKKHVERTTQDTATESSTNLQEKNYTTVNCANQTSRFAKKNISTEIEVTCLMSSSLTCKQGRRELVSTGTKKSFKDASTEFRHDRRCVLCGGNCSKRGYSDEKSERIPKSLLTSSALSKRHAICGREPIGPKCDKCKIKLTKQGKCLNSLEEYRKECICEICGDEVVLCIVCGKEVDSDYENEEVKKEEYYEILKEIPASKCGYCGRDMEEHKQYREQKEQAKEQKDNSKSKKAEVFYTKARRSNAGSFSHNLSYISVDTESPLRTNNYEYNSKSRSECNFNDKLIDKIDGYHCSSCFYHPCNIPIHRESQHHIDQHGTCNCTSEVSF